MDNCLSRNELLECSFRSLGNNVKISRDARLYNCNQISLGSNIRIDDFCIISAGRGGVIINNYIHLGCYSSLIGAGEIEIGNYSNISSRVSIYSSNDDYSGESLTNPTIPEDYKRLNISPVYIGEHVIIGSNTTILPGVNIERGVAIGAHSFVKESCEGFKIYAGNPVRKIGHRSKKILQLQSSFEREE